MHFNFHRELDFVLDIEFERVSVFFTNGVYLHLKHALHYARCIEKVDPSKYAFSTLGNRTNGRGNYATENIILYRGRFK